MYPSYNVGDYLCNSNGSRILKDIPTTDEICGNGGNYRHGEMKASPETPMSLYICHVRYPLKRKYSLTQTAIHMFVSIVTSQ